MPQKIPRLLNNVPVANSSMAKKQVNCMRYFFGVLFSTIVVGKTLKPEGSNSRIVGENAAIKGEEG